MWFVYRTLVWCPGSYVVTGGLQAYHPGDSGSYPDAWAIVV